MDFKVIWSDQAIEDLRDLCGYIARHDPEAALGMGKAMVFLTTFTSWRSSLLSGRRILEERVERCERLSFGRTASSTMCARSHTRWRFCTFGTGLVTSLYSEWPNEGDAPNERLSRRFPRERQPMPLIGDLIRWV
jgi:plasmid stabilization system protein ParE